MEKKFRKEFEKQVGLTIAYFLKKQDEKVAAGMEKAIRSASRDLAKKFVKVRADQAKKLEVAKAKAEKQKAAAKKPAKKAVKAAKKKVAAKRPTVAKKKS